jgi:CRISPR system Cascade subunit CasA
MNLTIDPWIPAIRADGRRDLFSLQDLFAQAHELRDLAVKPHERIALMRLLLCIAQAALDGPEDENAWEQCHSLIQPRVRVYLD